MKIPRVSLSRLPLLIGCAIGGIAYAQGTGTLIGTVTDPAGSVVPGAKVTITNTATGTVRALVSNSAGSYDAPELQIGTYRVHVEAPGFKAYDQMGIGLTVGATMRSDVHLEVGATQESITVEANVVQVQSDTNEVSSLISGSQITKLDTNGRNPVQLATLMPGAASMLPDFNAPTALSGSASISFNGQRSQHNVWLIDGGENYDRGGGGGIIVSPSPDALAEFRVMTSNYSAEYGQASGGTISIALKSGTQQFHGGAWEFNRNDYFDANNFFSNKAGTAPPKLRYNAYGFNIGGPVILPHFERTEHKTFFFYNMEWRKLIQGNQINVNAMPSPEFGGDFSGLSTPIRVPQTTDPVAINKFRQYNLVPGQAFPNNSIPSGLIDPNAAKLLQSGIFPQPNTPDGSHYAAAAPVPTNLREEIVRIDHTFSDKLAIMGHLIYDTSSQSYATSLWSGDTYPSIGTLMTAPSYSSVVRLTHTISPTLLNEISYNFNGNQLHLFPTGTFTKPSGYNVPEFFPANNNNRIPVINLGSPYGVNYDTASWPWNNAFTSHQAKDDFSWTHGNHSFRFGGGWMGTWKAQDIFGNTNGNYTFDGSATGNSFADFLLGYAHNYHELDIQDAVHIYTNTLSFYAADNWRVSKRLTVNLGMRWEGVPHAYDQRGRLSNFYPGQYNYANVPQFNPDGSLNPTGPGFATVPGVALSDVRFYLNGIGLAGKNGIPRGLVQDHWMNFGPRVGLAYSLGNTQATVIRAGFGMFYERIQGNDVYNMGPNPPFSFDPSPNFVYFSNPTVSYLNGLQASKPVFPGNLTTLNYTGYKLPTSMQYSFQIQRQLTRAAVMTVGYVGSANYNQPNVRNINTVPLNDPNRLAICGGNCGYTGAGYNANLDRIFPGFGNITQTEATGNSSYNSLQISFNWQNWHGLSFQGAYTYAHAIDTGSGDLNSVSNPFNRNYDRGSADFDRRHVAVFSYTYELPFFRDSQNAFVKAVLGGWDLSGITMFETGTPLNITLSYDNLGLGGGTTSRPNVVGRISYPQTVDSWFSASFSNPVGTQFGNSGRNTVVGPGRDNWNVSLFKSFAIKERAHLELRFETYNTFNHTQFNAVNNTYGNGSFGAVNSTFDPRTLQLGGKFTF